MNRKLERGQKSSYVWQSEVPSPKDRTHPTQKPIELYTRPIQSHTEAGDVVYAPFAESGVIFVAAQETGRIALGVEIEPHF